MRNAKRQAFIFTISIIVISFVVVMISFNLVMQNYIKNEAVKTITQKIKEYTNGTPTYTDENSITTYSDEKEYGQDSVQVDAIFLNLNYEAEKGVLLFEREKRIIENCKETPQNDREIRFASINNEDFYITQVHVKGSTNSINLIVVDTATGITGTTEYSDNSKQEDYILLLYSRVTPLNLLSKSMNIVFLIILLVGALLSGYCGIRFGKQIENSQEKLKQFFQNVSHELKTPIMSIQGYAEGIQTKVIEDPNKAIEVIIHESEKMSDLVEELLYISKIDSGQLTVKKEPIEINELIYDCLRSIEMIAQNNDIEIKIDFDEISPIIYGDEKQLAKAFTNIIVNAVKYAKSQISIKCRKNKKYIEIFFCDDGDGINEEDLPHVFERFYKGKNGNTGIGLALTKEIIDIHKGKVTAGNIDKGAIFTVILRNLIN